MNMKSESAPSDMERAPGLDVIGENEGEFSEESIRIETITF